MARFQILVDPDLLLVQKALRHALQEIATELDRNDDSYSRHAVHRIAMAAHNAFAIINPKRSIPAPRHELARAIGIELHESSDPSDAALLASMAMELRTLGCTQEALQVINRALTAEETLHGPVHPNVAVRLSELALILIDLGQPEDALRRLELALDIDTAFYGPTHPEVVTDLANLSFVYWVFGNAPMAYRLSQQAFSIIKDSSTPYTYRDLIKQQLEMIDRRRQKGETQ